jgi:hypothetical protein
MLKYFVYIKYECGIQSVVVWSLKHDTTKSFGLNRRQYGEILGSWQEELYHELMIRDFILREALLKQLHLTWLSMCVALWEWEVWGHNIVEGGLQ